MAWEPFEDWLDTIPGESILSEVLNALWDAVTWLLRVLAAILTALFNGILALFGYVGSALKWLWENVIKAGVLKLANLIIKAHLWLEEHLAPVLKFLLKIRNFIDRIFRLYIRPVLVLIQKIRQVLLILRLLHIKWAQTLDTYLTKIQADISRVFLTIRGTLNAMIDVVNAVSNPTKLVRLVAASVAVRRSLAGLVRISTGMPLGFFWPNYRSDAQPWEKPVLRASDLRDPARNPLTGTLFGAFDPIPVSDFMAADPIPTDAQLNQADPLPYYVAITSFMEESDARIDDRGAVGLEAERLVREGTGNLAATFSMGIGALAVLAPDLPAKGAY